MRSTSSPTHCDIARQLASVQLDAGLPDVDRRRLARHRSECADCDSLIREMASVTRAVRAAEPLPAPHAAPVRRAHRPRRRLVAPLARGAGAVAALAICASLGFLIGAHSHASPQSQAPVAEKHDLVLALATARTEHLRCRHVTGYGCGRIVPLGTPLVTGSGGVAPPNALRTTWR
jgi:predicted anti-sigma-YlaC factor YlaD